MNTPKEPKVFADSEGAQSKRFDNLFQVRYIEIFLAGRKVENGDLVAACYNTTFTSVGIPVSKDTAPNALVEGLDFDKIKSEYGVIGASLNGPKLWMINSMEAELGMEREFNGLKAIWCAQLNMNDFSFEDKTPYKSTTIARKSAVGWNRGNTVMLLDDAENNTWIMKGFQLNLKPQYTYEEFFTAGASNFKKLPPGWKFRIKTLEEDLIEVPETGVATIMSDEFFNVYDKTGPGMTNYKP